MNKTELIEKYLSGEMNASEMAAFENNLGTDPILDKPLKKPPE